MDENRLIELLMSVNERLARIEVKSEELRLDMREHMKDISALRAKVDDIEKEVARAKASIATLRWVIAGAFGAPGVLYACAKLLGLA